MPDPRSPKFKASEQSKSAKSQNTKPLEYSRFQNSCPGHCCNNNATLTDILYALHLRVHRGITRLESVKWLAPQLPAANHNFHATHVRKMVPYQTVSKCSIIVVARLKPHAYRGRAGEVVAGMASRRQAGKRPY